MVRDRTEYRELLDTKAVSALTGIPEETLSES
jgi:hypothetical protein